MTTKPKKKIVSKKAVVPEIPVVVQEPEPTRLKKYWAEIYYEREPLQKDIYAGTIVYSETTNIIKILYEDNRWGADLQIVKDNAILIDGMSYSHGDPKFWISNLHNAKLYGNLVAREVTETYEN